MPKRKLQKHELRNVSKWSRYFRSSLIDVFEKNPGPKRRNAKQVAVRIIVSTAMKTSNARENLSPKKQDKVFALAKKWLWRGVALARFSDLYSKKFGKDIPFREKERLFRLAGEMDETEEEIQVVCGRKQKNIIIQEIKNLCRVAKESF